jgi:ribosomal protein S18 acetylase RimI-like enzyme
MTASTSCAARGDAPDSPVEDVLDDPVRAALLGPQAHFAVRRGQVLRYAFEVSPFVSLPPEPGLADWRDAAALAGADGTVLMTGPMPAPPDGLAEVTEITGYQLTGEDVAGEHDDEVVRLGPADVPEMLDLVRRTQPGPFLPRTVELGVYLGIRRGGALAAMAGERMRPPGWTEISAVCTDPAHQGQGLAGRLIRAVVAGVRERGERPFLPVADGNPAIRLYERLGFRIRRPVTFRIARLTAPARVESGS